VEDDVLEDVLVQLRRYQLVDDRAFAEYWVEQRQTFRPRGARLIQSELSRLGVARASADGATSTLAESAEEDAYRAARKRAQRLRGPQREFETRLGQWLARRGFDWDTITRVVARLWAETAAG